VTTLNPHPPAPLHVAVALDGAGWHPAAWREPAAASAEDLFAAPYWAGLVGEAERGLLDFVTIEDSLGLQSTRAGAGADRRVGRVRGRLDAVLIAARVAPLTRHIGLVPTAVVTHTEPFHLSKAIATLDYVSTGRTGIRIQVSARADEAALFGRRRIPPAALAALERTDRTDPGLQDLLVDLFDEATDYVEVLRRLWDSWEDDAEIRDEATGRFVDREKLHYIDFSGAHFDVRGPSITPRPPQGQPLVTALAHETIPYRFAARSCDVAYVTPRDRQHAQLIVEEIRSEQTAAGRTDETVHIFGDLVVFLDSETGAAADRRSALDALAGEAFSSDATAFAGTPAELADLLLDWQQGGLSGFRLRPGALPHDLEQITRGLVPELQRRSAFRNSYEATTLRGLLGLTRPANRYAAAG
jgi:alkanesulfonate monooxygenase SsuD/methylene tetrahydromethanopterin reductase-like flavin-dependent oxidoreductase (luciferase family)